MTWGWAATFQVVGCHLGHPDCVSSSRSLSSLHQDPARETGEGELKSRRPAQVGLLGPGLSCCPDGLQPRPSPHSWGEASYGEKAGAARQLLGNMNGSVHLYSSGPAFNAWQNEGPCTYILRGKKWRERGWRKGLEGNETQEEKATGHVACVSKLQIKNQNKISTWTLKAATKASFF